MAALASGLVPACARRINMVNLYEISAPTPWRLAATTITNYRMVFYLENNLITLLRIGTHEVL